MGRQGGSEGRTLAAAHTAAPSSVPRYRASPLPAQPATSRLPSSAKPISHAAGETPASWRFRWGGSSKRGRELRPAWFMTLPSGSPCLETNPSEAPFRGAQRGHPRPTRNRKRRASRRDTRARPGRDSLQSPRRSPRRGKRRSRAGRSLRRTAPRVSCCGSMNQGAPAQPEAAWRRRSARPRQPPADVVRRRRRFARNRAAEVRSSRSGHPFPLHQGSGLPRERPSSRTTTQGASWCRPGLESLGSRESETSRGGWRKEQVGHHPTSAPTPRSRRTSSSAVWSPGRRPRSRSS